MTPPPAYSELRIHGWQANVFGPVSLLLELEDLFPARERPPLDGLQPHSSTFEVALDSPQSGWQQIMCDGEPVWTGHDTGELLAHLEWAINRTAAEWLGQRYLLFHAGAVACEGRGLILPAPSGGGKTTLVAGLVAAGFEYLSDEVAMIEPSDLSLLPFAKSLCVKAGGREVLMPLYPALAEVIPRRRFGGEPVWYLPLRGEIRSSTPVRARYVVLPSYQPEATTALRPLRRSAALQRLLEQSFNLRVHGASAVGRLVEMLRQTECYALSVGSLQSAVDVLGELARDS